MPHDRLADAAGALNALAVEVADLEPGDALRLRRAALLVMDAAALLPMGAIPPAMEVARLLLAMRVGALEFDEGYAALSAAVDRASMAVDSADGDHERVDSYGLPNPDELSMDLAVLKGLAMEIDEDPCGTASAMEQLSRRMLMAGLPAPLASMLEYLASLFRACSRGSVPDETGAELTDSLHAVEKVFSRLLEHPHEREGFTGNEENIEVPTFEFERAERYLQELEELESSLLSLEKGAKGSSQRIVAIVSGLLEESAALALHPVSPACEDLLAVIREHRGPFPREAVGALLELKDLLEEHLCSLLDGGFGADLKLIEERLGAAAVRLRSGTRRKAAAGPASTAAELVLRADESEVRDFLAEAPEYLQMIEGALLDLERDVTDSETLNEAFRGFHNLKGSAGFLKLEEMVAISHAAESLLSEAREGRLVLSGPLADLAFEALDMLKRLLEGVEAASCGARWAIPEGIGDLADRLRRAAAGESPRSQQGTWKESGRPAAAHRPRNEVPGLTEAQAPSGAQVPAGKGESLVRVSTRRLDALIDAVGELVISHSMVTQEKEIAETANPRLARNVSQLTKITRELQELAMGMRMVSLKSTFQKMARLARDLSAKSGTLLDFVCGGEDTEIDRNLVEEINSPLVHMVRNAVDHGLEPPEERKRRGKPERGRLSLRGYHEGGNVVIELSDDGRGLDPDAILEKALRLGVVKQDDVPRLSRDDVYRLIFHEGLSTAREVTDISGRGVGMDVVKKTIEGLRGRVDISSRPGEGTAFTVRLPLTLAIIDGMVVRVAGEEYVVPSISIHSSFRPEREQVFTLTGKGEVLSLRGEIIPLFRLQRLFGLRGAEREPWEALALIMGSNGDRCAVLVDDILGQQQVVIKSLGDMFSRLPGVSGGAIMGSGKVALILDPPGLVGLAQGRGGA